jgi:hypothetical protein
MGLLRDSKNNGKIPYYTGLQIQTSGSNIPISIVWGANKIAPNCIWTGGFYGYYGYPEGSGGGKGGLSGGNNNGGQNWQYYTSWEMGLCEGPIHQLGTIWTGQSATNTYGADIWAVFPGNQTQNAWNVIENYFPGQALNYRGLAYITSYNYYLGTSANLPQFSMEIQGLLFNSAGINGGDADPAQIIQDFLTSSQYGVGFPAGSIDATTLFSPSSGSDSSYQGYCRASYLALSPALTNQEAANSILARWLQLTNSAAVWSGGKLKFIPYGDSVIGPTPNQIISSGVVTFTPNVTPIYALTDDDFIHEDGKDPVEITRTDPYACHNWQRLQINERVNSLLPLNVNEPWVLWQDENSYVPMPIDVWDQNAIELYGLRMASDINANEICDPRVAQISAQLILQRGLYIRNHYKFKLSFEYCLLDPMDLVNIMDAALGLNGVTVRITEIEEDDAGVLSVSAEEFPEGIASAVEYMVQANGSNSTNQNVVPARVNPPFIFEPTASLTGGIANVFIAASGGVATAYMLAEDSSTGQHYTSQTVDSSQAMGTQITFSVYARALPPRSACRLNFNLGAGVVGCDFNLSTGSAGTPNTIVTGVITASIVNAGGGTTAAVTISLASPAVVTWAANGLVAGQAVMFSTTGALPTGLAANTVYYASPVTANTFNVAATPGGTLINTSGTQSGTQTGVSEIWYQCSISAPMQALATPVLSILLESPVGTTSYTGTSGNGIYIWGAEYSAGLESLTFLPAFLTVVGATLAANGVTTPEGVAGIADPNWGGANVWLSTDGNSYTLSGQVLGPSRQGVLTANVGNSGGNPDTTDNVYVSLQESGGTLSSGTAADAQNGVTLCLIDRELFTYETATLQASPNTYKLSTLYRGFYGTTPTTHLIGAPFVRVDSTVFQYALPAQFIGETIYVKLQSFNIFGKSTEDLSECSVYTYTPSGSGSPVGPVTKALLLGQNLDFGLVASTVTETDQWGIVTDGIMLAKIDLGAGI